MASIHKVQLDGSSPSVATPESRQPRTSSQQRVVLPIDNAVEDVLLWRKPIVSGGALALATAVYILLVWTNRSFISLVATLTSVLVLASFIWSVVAQYTSRPGPPVPRILREGVSESEVKSFVEAYTPRINQGLALLNRVATAKDFVLLLKVVLALFTISKLGKVFSVLTWAYVVVLAAFSVPKLYELKKPEIDAAAANAHAQTKQLYDQHVAPTVARLPRGSSATPSKQL